MGLSGIFGKLPSAVNPGAATVNMMSWRERFQHLLLPATCLLCGAEGVMGRDLCAGCAAVLPRNALACPGCAASIAPGQTGLCRQCQMQPRSFDRAFAPFRYRPPVDFLICGLKFAGRLSYARLLGDLFTAALAESPISLPDCIIPVPLHPLRLRERGFNQALELARVVARRRKIPLIANGLQRVRHTLRQTDLDAHHRQLNPLGAFAIGQTLPGARVALIDDVMTTGSTAAECARILRDGGAVSVEVWAVGRAGGDSLSASPKVNG